MIKKRLISFGDSWPRGSELLTNQKPFGELLAEQLGCAEFSNYSQPASSVNHLLVQLRKHLARLSSMGLDPSEWMAVFCLTDQHRGSTAWQGEWIFQNANGGFGGPHADRSIVATVNDHYWKYTHSNELSDLNTNSSMLALQSICKTHHIDDYYIAGWQKFVFWPEVNLNKIYKSAQVSCNDLVGANLASGGHPNQQGHESIADALYQWMVNDA